MPKNRICKLKDGRYTYQVMGTSGKRMRINSFVGETKKKFSTRCNNLDRKATQDSGGTTLDALHEMWMRNHVSVHCSNAHYLSCERVYLEYVHPLLGNKEVEDITRKDVAEMLTFMETKGLKRSSISKARSAISAPFNWAIDTLGFELRTPTDGLVYRTKRTAEDEDTLTKSRRCLTREEVKRILQAASGSKYEEYFQILSMTGLRPSEGLGLQVKDVDFKEGVLHIQRGVTMYDMSPLKTVSGRRDIPLFPKLRETLQRQIEHVAFTTKEGWLFPSATGTPSMNALKCAFHRTLSQTAKWETGGHNGMKKVALLTPPVKCVLYDFRHTFATRMAEKGMSAKMLQTLMGHRDIQTTLTYYVDVTEEMKKEASNLMASDF